MDAWPRIPQSQGGTIPSRTGASSLPPAGTVIMASVEEDLGNGVYALRWAGNRISVSSRAILATGQSLILKSEISAEGKPTLVVQGPALPDSGTIVDRVIYGPGNRHGADESRGDQTGQAGRGGQGDSSIGLAAGVAQAASAPSGPPLVSLLGLVLEPLADLDREAEALLRLAEEEKAAWQQTGGDAKKTDGNVSGEKTGSSSGVSSSEYPAVTTDTENPIPDRHVPETRPDPTPRSGDPIADAAVDGRVAKDVSVAGGPEGRPAIPSGEGVSSAMPPPEMKPEVFLKEALTRLVKAAELPLASPAADSQSLGISSRMPGAVLDKAADILLRAAGLTPDEATIEAAKALIDNNVQVDRQIVQAMLALAAGHEGADREAVLRAAARLAARDLPLAAPLVGGMAEILDRRAGVGALLDQADAALAVPSGLPAARPLLDAAREMLNLLRVDLQGPDAALALERYISTFGREALGKALSLIETAAQAALENHPLLPRFDQAIGAILRLLEQDPAAGEADAAMPVPPGGGASSGASGPVAPETGPAPGPLPEAEAVEDQDAAAPSRPPPLSAPPPPGSPVNAHVPAARPVIGAEIANPPPTPAATKPDSIFSIPGLNRPELELLRPNGVLERFLDSGAETGGPDAKTAAEAGRLAGELLSDDPEKAERALRDLPGKERPVLRETAARLSRAEAEILRSDPLAGRLADAAGALRDLGRQLLAAKAENLAGQNREPGVMLAEIPFKLADNTGDGRMQMFYRRSRSPGEGWSSRVILDLNTTVMGPVLGDMRFFGQDMALNMFVEKPATAEFLARSADELAEGLLARGFRLKSRFMVLPPPPPPPETKVRARPEVPPAPEPVPEKPGAGTIRKGRLDIRG